MVVQCREYSQTWLNLTFAAWSLTFCWGHKAFLVFHAEQVIIGLPCGQGQLSRIWKVQCDWLSLEKECCSRLSRRERWALLKTPAWEANKKDDTTQNLVHHTLIVTFPLVTFLILNPTVGIMSSLNWPDWKDNIPQITTLLYSRV